MDVLKFSLRARFVAALSVMILLSPTLAQDKKQTQVESTPPADSLISVQEKIDIYPKLQSAEEVAILANNAVNAGVGIVRARIKAIKRDESRLSSNDVVSRFVTEYVMQGEFTFRNNTDRKITGIGLQFTNSETHSLFFVYPNKFEIEVAGEQQFKINFMALAGNPASLNVEIVGLRFLDGTTWKSFPLPPTNAIKQRPAIANPQVETKPRPLNSLRPRYTELARQNRIIGNVRLQITIGTNGAVNYVQVLNALPDGLTEEAIHLVKVLQFKPAMAGGSPVEYSIILDIEFLMA
jgi:TonB family protein